MRLTVKSLLLTLAMASAVACGPSRYMMHLEMRYPSKSGMELAGKNVSIVYMENGSALNDGFNSTMAERMASVIESDYGTGEGSIGIYRMTRSKGDYSSKDTLTNLLMDTGADLVFLLDTVKFGTVSIGGPTKVTAAVLNKNAGSQTKNSGRIPRDSAYVNIASMPFSLSIYAYDSMGKEDEVKLFGGTAVAQASVYSDGRRSADEVMTIANRILPDEGKAAGELVGASFQSQWKVEDFSVAYYDSAKWIEALQKADQLDWKGAMDIWFELLDSMDIMKRACASYNIALSCHMLGDYKLAEEWLDLSDKETELPMSVTLRKRINLRK